jgi:hypothetical protein
MDIACANATLRGIRGSCNTTRRACCYSMGSMAAMPDARILISPLLVVRAHSGNGRMPFHLDGDDRRSWLAALPAAQNLD